MGSDPAEVREIIGILKDIRTGINILAGASKDRALNKLSKVKGKRKQMYKMLNGKNSLEDISKKLKTTYENVRLFVVQCEKDGLVEFVKGRRGTKYPKALL